jgi:hypothetical protein
MLAEPKTKRRVDGSPQDMFGPQVLCRLLHFKMMLSVYQIRV